ncbi:hypothetical protein ACLOJK_021241 [Asimina triloba]
MDGGRILVVAGERLDDMVGVLLSPGSSSTAGGCNGFGRRWLADLLREADACDCWSLASGGRDGGVRSGRGRWTVAGSPPLVVAGLGKMMEHHTGAPCSSGVPYMVYLQM